MTKKSVENLFDEKGEKKSSPVQKRNSIFLVPCTFLQSTYVVDTNAISMIFQSFFNSEEKLIFEMLSNIQKVYFSVRKFLSLCNM